MGTVFFDFTNCYLDSKLSFRCVSATLAVQQISIGDTTIKTVAEYYAKSGFQVEILTEQGTH